MLERIKKLDLTEYSIALLTPPSYTLDAVRMQIFEMHKALELTGRVTNLLPLIDLIADFETNMMPMARIQSGEDKCTYQYYILITSGENTPVRTGLLTIHPNTSPETIEEVLRKTVAD